MLSTICEFIPQMIFLNSIFGYLCILIIVKWVTGQYADLYNVLIRMFLGLGDVLPANQLFSGQKGLQQFLLAIAFISVPWMLVPKPLILKKRWEESQKGKAQRAVQMSNSLGNDEDEGRRPEGGHGSSSNLLSKSDPEAGHGGGGGGGHGHGHGDHFDFGEVCTYTQAPV
jgi:V-type H+-transporting ATPase subunit a